MITIRGERQLSRLIFLSDMYRNVLDVQGSIFHLAADPDNADLSTWRMLRDIYEPALDKRPIHVFYTDDDLDKLSTTIDAQVPVVALAYFDSGIMGRHVSECLRSIVPLLTRGSVVAFSNAVGGVESDTHVPAIMNTFGLNNIALQRWHFSRNDSYTII